MKKCPKHNPESTTTVSKSIMVKCDAQGVVLNPHCRVHAKGSNTGGGTSSILKLSDQKQESKANLVKTPPPRLRRAKTPPPTLQLSGGRTSPAATMHHRHSHHEFGTQTMATASKSESANNNNNNNNSKATPIKTTTNSRIPKTAEQLELDAIVERVYQAEVFLNAMGHAATSKNSNSSRFGKFFDIQIDYKGDIVGAHLTQCEYLWGKGDEGEVVE